MSSKKYVGYRLLKRGWQGKPVSSACLVEIHYANGPIIDLPPRREIRNHSPTGYEWGYAGSGPAQLSLAICYDLLRDRTRALHVYQQFKHAVVARFPTDGWELTAETALAVILALEDEEKIGEIGDQSPEG